MTKQTKIIFFIDRSMGKRVAGALYTAGASIEVHDNHFAPETLDIEWLPAVSQKGWVVLTKDKAIGRNPLELIAIAHARAKVFTLVSGNLNRQEMANICVSNLPQMEKFSKGNRAPFIAKIYKNSPIKLWKNHVHLRKLI